MVCAAAIWENKHAGATGRIGLLYDHFVELNGYDEALYPYTCQDIDLLRRVGKFGVVDACNKETNGWSVANSEGQCMESQSYGRKKAHEVKWAQAHLDGSLQNVSEKVRDMGWKAVEWKTLRNPQALSQNAFTPLTHH